MMSVLVIAPIVLPLLAAAVVFAGFRSLAVQRTAGLAGAFALLFAGIALAAVVWRSGPCAVHIGGWPPFFAITLVADTLASMMVVLASMVGAAVALYSLVEIDDSRLEMGYFGLLMVLLAGVNGAFLTSDLFNLYVCFEVMLMASFVLMVLGGDRHQKEGGLKYVTLNLVSSALFLAGVGIVYGATSTLNLSELAARVPAVAAERPEVVVALAGLFLVAFGIKAGLFPLYFWLPASYHTPPVAVSAVFAGLLTKVGVYALIRVFSSVFVDLVGLFEALVVVAMLTMVSGVLGAVAQFHFRRILSFHIVSQIGYMVLCLGLLAFDDPAVRRLALAAAVFYIAHHILVKTNLFLIAGVVRRLRGTEDLGPLGGLATSAPWLAALFLIPAASLAGIPPLSGFWAKLAVLKAAVLAEAWPAVAAALFAGLLTLLSMTKIWNEAFWKKPESGLLEARTGKPLWPLVLPIVTFALLTVVIGLAPQLLFAIADRAAVELLNLEGYRTVIGFAGNGQ